MTAAQVGACAMVPIHREHQPHTSVERHGLPVASIRHCWPVWTQSADLMKDVASRRNSQGTTPLAMKPAGRNKRIRQN